MINKKRLAETFLDLIKIDSPSEDEGEMVKEVLKRCKKLGLSAEKDNFGNVIAKLKGTGESVMLNAHLDTVEPGRGIKAVVEGDIIKSDGKTILGGDDKAGIAIILEALASLKESKIKHLPIEVVFTLGEESGLFGAINLDYSKVEAKRGITFDGAGKVSNVTIAGPGYHRVNVTIFGRDAHAGVEPEKGISAIKIASEIISQLQLGRIDEETSANIGLIEGGTARNSVPDRAHFKGEIRSRDKGKLEKHAVHFHEVFDRVLANYPEAKIEREIVEEFGAYSFNKEQKIIKLILETFGKMGIIPNLEPSGGGSDVNIFNNNGIEIVDVGIGVYDPHTTREYLVISEMEESARFCEQLLIC